MYRELANKYRKDNPLKIIEVAATEISPEVKFYLKELNAGEKMHLFYVFDNDLKTATEDDRMLYALNMMLCDHDGDRTEKAENYSYLCDLPHTLLQRLLQEAIKLISVEPEVKKSLVQSTDS